MDDIAFLEEVIAELDRGWVTETMCDDTGKCLVGAGAVVLGHRYLSFEASEALAAQDSERWITYFQESGKKETEAGKRLFKLLSFEDTTEEGYDLLDDEIVDTVTTFNDSYTDYSELRPRLVAALNDLKLRAEQ